MKMFGGDLNLNIDFKRRRRFVVYREGDACDFRFVCFYILLNR